MHKTLRTNLRPWCCSLAALLLCILACSAQAAWFDAAWAFRRLIDVAETAGGADPVDGEQLAVAEFYTAGHALPKGQDLRVATDEGRLVASRLLTIGPGDRASIAFALQKGVQRYYVYFGNPNPAPSPKGVADVNNQCGIFMEMRPWSGGQVNNASELEAAWTHSKDVIGSAFIDSMLVGVNPFDDRGQIITQMTASLRVPADGQYLFAGSAQHRAALWIDDKPVLFISGLVPDIRFNAKVDLTKGRHDLRLLWACGGKEPCLSMVWQRPGDAQVRVLGHEAFGTLGLATIGPLEERNKTLTADFKSDYAGECFYNDHYAYRYRFEADGPKTILAAAKCDWDFGDGQHAVGPVVEHVYLSDGQYPVKLTLQIGANSDSQTTQFVVCRDRKKIVNPPEDKAHVLSMLVATYDLSKAPPAWLTWAVLLHARARATRPMLEAADLLARQKTHADPHSAFAALRDATTDGLLTGHVEEAMALWDAIPADSNLNPAAARYQARLLLWQTADFPKAVRVLEPLAQAAKDTEARRLYGDALVLDDQADRGRKILQQLPIDGPPEKQAAISGAMAFTVEDYIKSGDWESGQEAWERWQAKYPAEFLEGYSVLLETKLMELKKSPEAAARLAEAFANAVPHSSYAPQLLDRAAKLLAKSNPDKSNALRQRLKERYPEDPLSQDTPPQASGSATLP